MAPRTFFRQKFTKVLGWKKLFLGKHKFMLSRLWIAENWIWRLIYPAWNKDSHWKSMVGRWIFLLGRPIFRGPCWFCFFREFFTNFSSYWTGTRNLNLSPSFAPVYLACWWSTLADRLVTGSFSERDLVGTNLKRQTLTPWKKCERSLRIGDLDFLLVSDLWKA